MKNSLRSIEWDVEDLEDTIQIVEKNPTKFRIDGAELAVRKGFIESTKDEVRRMKERLTNQSRGNLDRLANSPTQHTASGPNKYSRLSSTADSPHREYIVQLEQQQEMLRRQVQNK